jgi:hypothetical protein
MTTISDGAAAAAPIYETSPSKGTAKANTRRMKNSYPSRGHFEAARMVKIRGACKKAILFYDDGYWRLSFYD